MIGILLALQVNNWNEERKILQSELILLKNLKEEFVANQNQFQAILDFKKERLDNWVSFLAIITDQSLSKEKRAINRPTNGAIEFNISNNALHSVLNSGKLEILSNDSLQYLLTSWGNDLRNYKEIEDRHRNFVENDLRRYEFAHRLFPNLKPIGYDYENPFLEFYSKQEIKDLLIDSHSKLNYQNLFMTNLMWLKLSVQRGEVLRERFEKIIAQLNQAIENH